MRTSELTGAALDWAVAKCEGNVRLQYDSREGLIINNVLGWIPYRPSQAWQQAGPIIEREWISMCCINDSLWEAEINANDYHNRKNGPTPLIAAMRCYVASKLGDEVEIPTELTKGEST